jgi:hypothetical protein
LKHCICFCKNLQVAIINCSSFVSSEHPESNTIRTFYNAWKSVTDYGPCCLISPFANFVNNETKNIFPSEYTSAHWHLQPKGSKNGETGGLKLILDVESFDFTFSQRESFGFRVEFSDQRDKSMINQDGYLISPGKIQIDRVPFTFLNTKKQT